MAKKLSDEEIRELNQRAQAVQNGWLASKGRSNITTDNSHQRQTISRYIGALKGIEAFQIGEYHIVGNSNPKLISAIGINSISSGSAIDFRPWQCSYPDDESLWSERQRQMVDSLCVAIGMVKV